MLKATRRPVVLLGVTVGVGLGVAVGEWNPWNLIAVSWLNQPVLGGFVIWGLLVGFLCTAARFWALRLAALLGLGLIGLAAVLLLPFALLWRDFPTEGTRELPVGGSDLRLIVEERPAIPGRRIDTLTIRADRGPLSRENTILVVRTDLSPATIEVVLPATVIAHACHGDEIVDFDPGSLVVRSRTRSIAGWDTNLPAGDLTVPFAGAMPTPAGCNLPAPP
jgi:hypothetical protein